MMCEWNGYITEAEVERLQGLIDDEGYLRQELRAEVERLLEHLRRYEKREYEYEQEVERLQHEIEVEVSTLRRVQAEVERLEQVLKQTNVAHLAEREARKATEAEVERLRAELREAREEAMAQRIARNALAEEKGLFKSDRNGFGPESPGFYEEKE